MGTPSSSVRVQSARSCRSSAIATTVFAYPLEKP
jgi:hypothetical protein